MSRGQTARVEVAALEVAGKDVSWVRCLCDGDASRCRRKLEGAVQGRRVGQTGQQRVTRGKSEEQRLQFDREGRAGRRMAEGRSGQGEFIQSQASTRAFT